MFSPCQPSHTSFLPQYLARGALAWRNEIAPPDSTPNRTIGVDGQAAGPNWQEYRPVSARAIERMVLLQRSPVLRFTMVNNESGLGACATCTSSEEHRVCRSKGKSEAS
jgi:hypothetical protein